MTNLFADVFKNSVEYMELNKSIKDGLSPIALYGLSGSSIAHVAYSLSTESCRQSLIVTYNELEAKKIYEDLKFFNQDMVYFFPSKEIVFYDVYAHSSQIREERLRVIDALINGEGCIVVTTIDSILLKLMPQRYWISNQVHLKVGEVIDLKETINRFVHMGYERVDMVEGKGQFSLRGGIVDIFPFYVDNPYRLELFDDEVDSIRIFDVESQISQEKLNEVVIKPARELILETELIKNGITKINEEFKKYEKKIRDDERIKLKEKIEEIKSNLENGIYHDGIDNFIHYFVKDTETLVDYFREESLVFIHEPSRIKERAQNYLDDFYEKFKVYFEKGEALPGQANLLENYNETLKHFNKKTTILINSLLKKIRDFVPEQIIGFAVKDMNSYHGKLKLLIEDIKRWKYKGYKIILLSGTKEKGRNLEKELRDNGVEGLYIDSLSRKIFSGQTFIAKGSLSNGFIYDTFKFAVISDKEVYGITRKYKRIKKRKDGSRIKSFRDLNVGDYVVHENHGIGKYVGIDQLTIEGMRKDYIKIQYLGGDYLYVPIEQMDLIQKYIGGDERAPKLNKLGGTEWRKTKAKVKGAIEDMAKDLLKLYAIRKASQGHAFPPDTEWQKQFEDMFPYEETPDQLKCIKEIKKDMESNIPMDRLLCGDVGYGKTEVAIRAIFKAVMDGKQVAFLVPTTILAQQHYNTLMERMSKFPVKVEMLSRFRSLKQQKKIIEDLRTGLIDVVVGTHRLLSRDVKFKDLGLLIIDEEQRFGVKHKEELKRIRKNVDVLTLTATPIPRTLHMSLIGIRDMSIIDDPPEDRYPVETYVVPYNEGMVRDAIIKELERGGQVYFVYNRVQDIDKIASKIKKLVPEAEVAYAHGQMSENKLENIMIDFLNKEFDVLVCTTIIETGLDIGNVNTIIIYDADKMGLSQLYQLRGRVGRSNRIAYAYLTYRKDKALSEVAEKRLKAIKEFTELGSGFNIAMKDLEIRGAGNLLGAQQHGHMASIGYDLYCKLLEDTIRSLKGEEVEDVIETNIDININAYISDYYIENERHKLEIYKKIASIRDKQDAYDVEEEIEDRFGTIPEAVYNLISIAYIKALAQRLKISSISETDKGIKLEFDHRHKLNPLLISKISSEFGNKIILNCSSKPYFILKSGKDNNKLQKLKVMLEKISGFAVG